MTELFNFHKKSFIINEWQGPKYTSDMAVLNSSVLNFSNILKQFVGISFKRRFKNHFVVFAPKGLKFLEILRKISFWLIIFLARELHCKCVTGRIPNFVFDLIFLVISMIVEIIWYHNFINFLSFRSSYIIFTIFIVLNF